MWSLKKKLSRPDLPSNKQLVVEFAADPCFKFKCIEIITNADRQSIIACSKRRYELWQREKVALTGEKEGDLVLKKLRLSSGQLHPL